MWLRASTNVRPSQRHLPHATPARHTLVVFESCALVWRWLGFRGVGSDGGRYLADEGTSGRNKECVWRERDSCAPRINRCPAMTSNGLKAASAGERRNGGQGAQSQALHRAVWKNGLPNNANPQPELLPERGRLWTVALSLSPLQKKPSPCSTFAPGAGAELNVSRYLILVDLDTLEPKGLEPSPRTVHSHVARLHRGGAECGRLWVNVHGTTPAPAHLHQHPCPRPSGERAGIRTVPYALTPAAARTVVLLTSDEASILALCTS